MKRNLLVFAFSLAAVSGQAADFTVTSTADSSTIPGIPGTLRERIGAAQASPDLVNTIKFGPLFLTNQTITLTAIPITILKHLDIVGPGAHLLTISGGDAIALFVTEAVTVTISGLTIANGKTATQGGAVQNFGGNLTIDKCTLRDNSATSGGGAIANLQPGGTLNVTNSMLTANKTQSFGGAIYNAGVANINDSTVTANLALSDNGRGGGIYNETIGGIGGTGGTLNVNRSTITRNFAEKKGGGIFSQTGAKLNILQSTVSNNTAQREDAGGISCDGTTTIGSSTVSGNDAFTLGGGIYVKSAGQLTLSNSTVYGNSTFNQGGQGGGIYNEHTLILKNSTISANASDTGGGIFNNNSLTNPATVTLSNSIVATNLASTAGADIALATPVALILSSLGYNLIGNGDFLGGLLASDQVGSSSALIDPKLGPLVNNGGLTLTQALTSGSPAINKGHPSFATSDLPNDQRGTGFARVKEGRLDIGAFEVQGTSGGGGGGGGATLELVCPADVTVSVAEGASSGAAVYTKPALNDNAGNALDVNCSPDTGILVPLGTTPVTCTATNAAGASAGSCAFNVTVSVALASATASCNASGTSSGLEATTLLALAAALALLRSRRVRVATQKQ